MHKREPSFYIVDIFIAIFLIKRYTHDIANAQELKSNTLKWDASLRQLEIIGEAVKHLINMNILENQKYRKIVDFRNIIVHAYFGIDEEEVWYVITQKLLELKSNLNQIVNEKSIQLDEAIEFAKKENNKNTLLVDFLDSLL